MQRPRLVASDVDGTLLGPGEVPSARTRAVLGRMAAAGVPLVLATGRPPRWVPAVLRGIGLDGGADLPGGPAPVGGVGHPELLVVATNGAVLYDARSARILEADPIAPDAAAEVIAAVRAVLPGCGIAVERIAPAGADGGTGGRRDWFLAEPGYVHAWAQADHDEVDAATLAAEPAVKILARDPDRPSDEMAAAVRARVGHLVDVTYSASGGLVECSRRGVTKATGLAAAAARLGVVPGEIVAFGDMPNDVAMLSWVGHGVAMADGHPEVRAAADEVTAGHLEDGVATVLERWF